MKKRRNIRSRAKDALVVLFCLAGAAFSLYAFARELNAALVKLNEGPVATITFKYRSAQRRILERVLWDRLKQESPIYNYDTIRTAELSEATLHFNDGTSVDLTENTMIQVVVKDSSPSISLETGSIVASVEAGGSLGLSHGSSALRLSPGAVAAARAGSDANALGFRVLEGSAVTASGRQFGPGAQADLDASGVQRERGAVLASPRPNARFLHHGEGDFPVAFRLAEADDDTEYSLVLSQNRSFEGTKAERLSASKPFNAMVPEGIWYWKLLDGDDVSDEGQFRVFSAPDPTPIAPAEGYVYSFRARKPAIRFLWTSNPYASYWRLTVADNPGLNAPAIDQQCQNPSSIVSSLAEGKWYWRVTPWYPQNGEGFAGSTAVRSFTVRRSLDLQAPALLVPRNGEIVNTKSSARSLSFSWKDNPDIDTTRITISQSSSLDSPIVDAVVRDNVYTVDRTRVDVRDGQWYWAVRQQDFEGTASPQSEIRPFVALSGELVHRASFPPDDYSISTNLAADTRFTWKSNAPSEARFQVSSSESFSDYIVDFPQANGSSSGSGIPIGTWYWRVVSRIGENEITTQPRKFHIMPPLDPPPPVYPAPSGRVVLRPGVPTTFRWAAVEGATSYSLKLYRPASGSTPLYERVAIEGTEATLLLDSAAEGSWRWSVQAFAEETPLSTRRVGVIGQYPFELKQLKPIALASPADGDHIDGIEALLNPGVASWTSAEKATHTRLVISRKSKGLDSGSIDSGEPFDNRSIVIENPASEQRLPPLDEGTWYITVIGYTADGFNISPTKPARVTVSPIPRLPRCEILEPQHKTVLGPDFFVSRKTLTFSWQPVAGATHYRFELRSASGKILHSSAETTGTAVELPDLTVLDSGKFRWSVEAVRLGRDSITIQHGEVAKAEFTIDIPKQNAPRSRTTRTLYGN